MADVNNKLMHLDGFSVCMECFRMFLEGGNVGKIVFRRKVSLFFMELVMVVKAMAMRKNLKPSSDPFSISLPVHPLSAFQPIWQWAFGPLCLLQFCIDLI